MGGLTSKRAQGLLLLLHIFGCCATGELRTPSSAPISSLAPVGDTKEATKTSPFAAETRTPTFPNVFGPMASPRVRDGTIGPTALLEVIGGTTVSPVLSPATPIPAPVPVPISAPVPVLEPVVTSTPVFGALTAAPTPSSILVETSAPTNTLSPVAGGTSTVPRESSCPT